MDLYGSALWHLQKDTELALLAEELESSDNTQPQVSNQFHSHSSILIPILLYVTGTVCVIIINELL